MRLKSIHSQSQFPRQIVGVLHASVHAKAPRGGELVSRIADQKYVSVSEPVSHHRVHGPRLDGVHSDVPLRDSPPHAC